MGTIVLQGITWGHSRGYTPLVAFSQRFSEIYPQVEVVWKKRTLQEFADFPLENLIDQYDLLIIDHPWVGCAAAGEYTLPLDQHLSKDYLNNQKKNATGSSYLSYFYDGHQWALPIDAAVPAASYRTDLFKKNHAALPKDWTDLIHLAGKGKVAAPAIPIDLLMNFYTFCMAHGCEPFSGNEEVVDHETGSGALESMREFYSVLDKRFFTCNPIAVAELMTNTDDYWYCPFAYCYSNYSREGYSKKILQYADLVEFNGKKLRTTIGGTGIAVSSTTQHKEWALKLVEEIVSETCQSTFYVQHGGQPGHKAAWLNEDANQLCHDFFKNLLPVMENGYMRPRYNGYLFFQDHAGDPLHDYLLNGGKPTQVLEKMNQIYRKSLQPALVKL
ncbi:MAG: ABC transporter substrate-binding protein [Flavisolibacter sp.]